MASRRFHVRINLKLEAVTCPGVWLCTHGYLEITIKALGYFFRTGVMEPYFPLLCHDNFKMEGYFKNSNSIPQLISNLSREHLEITLWQSSRRLAYYEGVLMDLLHCIEPKLQCPHANTRQMLMKTTTAFPGIIAPKVEISTHLFIKDTILNIYNTSEDLKTCTNILKNAQVNRKLTSDVKPTLYRRPCTVATSISEDLINSHHLLRKQKTVCHTRDAAKKLLNDSVDIKSIERSVSIASSSSDNTHTSVGICDIEHDGHQEKFCHLNHEKLCELCRLYKKIFLQ